MGNFITNSKDRSLKERVSKLVLNSYELKFLVGFFYFSGLRELYQSIAKNEDVILNVLVGLNVDSLNYGLIEYAIERGKRSSKEIFEGFLDSLKKSINTDHFDTKEFYEQSNFFLNLIKSGRLNLRKTLEPNHSKLYLFKLKDNQIGRDKLFITGSSNLTASGLLRQHEFNVEISDYGFNDAEEYFDSLWKDSVKITENDDYKERFLKVVEKDTLIRKITPFEAYALVLKSYLDIFRGKDISQRLTDIFIENSYTPYAYQLDAIKQALGIVEQNNGVLIADVVGLGKTIIACALAYELKQRGIVIAPPGIIGDKSKSYGWNRYLEDFGLAKLGWQAYSSGDLKSAFDAVSVTRDIEVVIVDEAHRFRNQNTKDYELLKNICMGKKVILLTATPFNNKPDDIFSLLKLFVVPKKSSITLSDNLEAKFYGFSNIFDKLSYIKKNYNSPDPKKIKKAISNYIAIFGDSKIDIKTLDRRSRFIAKEIRDVIEPVTIRRNRLDLVENEQYRQEVKELSYLKDPVEWFFELTQEQSKFYDKVISEYFALPEDGGKFKGAIYKPYLYEQGKTPGDPEEKSSKEANFHFIQQLNLYDFMRRLLVKRFESSFGAFEQSIKNFIKITESVSKFVKKTDKYILDRDLLEKIYEMGIDEIEESLKVYAERLENEEHKKNYKIYELKKFKKRDEFVSDIESDLNLFSDILRELKDLNIVRDDPKVSSLVEKLRDILNKPPSDGEPKRKAVIFTEYRDTVKYLKNILMKAFDNRVLVVEGVLNASILRDIRKNFDVSYKDQEDMYDILLTTDMVSEGFNLNRAGIVVNYDIPWNPVRVIQRVGRINRISKKVFNELYIANFFPTERGSGLVRSRDIAASKMLMIHKSLGEDSKIFDPDEEPTASNLYKKIQQNPDKSEKESFYTMVYKEFEEIKKQCPDILDRLKDFPTRVKVAKSGDKDELFVIIKKGKLYVNHKIYDNEERNIRVLYEVIDSIRSKPEERALSLSERFWDGYTELKSLEDISKNKRGNISNSNEEKAKAFLNSLLRNDSFKELESFIKTLIEDIVDFGTLSEYTIRRIVDMEKLSSDDKIFKEMEILKKELKEDYLEKEKERLKLLKKEIIIAIENRKES
jgi:superfamily II DNA or RNA helicase